MQTAIEIKKLSREEKLRVMEAIWEDLSMEDDIYESPDWHQEVLRETELQFKADRLSVVDWNEAKKTLRKKFE